MVLGLPSVMRPGAKSQKKMREKIDGNDIEKGREYAERDIEAEGPERDVYEAYKAGKLPGQKRQAKQSARPNIHQRGTNKIFGGSPGKTDSRLLFGGPNKTGQIIPSPPMGLGKKAKQHNIHQRGSNKLFGGSPGKTDSSLLFGSKKKTGQVIPSPSMGLFKDDLHYEIVGGKKQKKAPSLF